jgi:hypothetical protein
MLLADVSAEVLPRSFLIAVIVVAPFAWWQWRRVKAVRAARLASSPAPEEPQATDAVAAVAPLEEVVALISEQARNLEPGEHWSLEIPRRVAIEGSEADPSLVDALVRDALRRERLLAVEELDAQDHRVLVCVKG